jgi:hypothetical protein
MKESVALFLTLTVFACEGHKKDDGHSGKSVSAVLKSSKLLLHGGMRLAETVALTNVTGLADSIGLNFTEDLSCGFNVWAADSQTTRSGKEGRTYEEFDLGDPVSWTSLGAGLQGECESAEVAQIESYFVYMDLHLSVSGENKIVRVYMGQSLPFEASDIVLKQGESLSWFDETSEQLVPSSSPRPQSPATFELAKEVPWFDNNGTEKIILMEFRINTDKAGYTVTANSGHVEVDVDFTNSGISVGDGSTDEALLKTIELPFLNPQEHQNLLVAGLTISEDRPPAEDPVAE